MTATPPPSGTVTFLFTDIEGSTRLEQRVGTDALRGPPRAPSRDPARGVRRPRRRGAGHRGRFVLRGLRQRPRGGRRRDRRAARPRAPSRGRTTHAVRVRMGLHTGEAEVGRRNPRRARHQPGGPDRGRGARRPDPRLGRDPGARRGRTCRADVTPARPRGASGSRTCPRPRSWRRSSPTACRQDFPPPRTLDAHPEQPADAADDLRRPRRRARRRPAACSGPRGC